MSNFCFLVSKSSKVSSSFFTSTRSISLLLFHAFSFAHIVKQSFSFFSASLMVTANYSFHGILTAKISLRFKLILLILDIKILFSLLTSCLALAFSAAIRLSLHFEYAALHVIMSCRLIRKLRGFTEWDIVWFLTIFFDTVNSALNWHSR